uniref:Major sperm protein n=1 Tax=Ascaris suum TaxID=6253 RepID=F1L6M0_ASCSU
MMSDFALKLEPDDKIVYSGKKLGEEPVLATLKITNPTKDRQVCKVKCTSNEMFRIRPPVFALKAEEEITVKLTFNAGKTIPDSGKHYYVVYYIKVDDEGKAPRACWAEHKGDPSGKKKLYVHFNKGEEGEKKEEEKKEDENKKEEDEKKDGEEKKEDKKEDEKKNEDAKKKDDEKKDDDKKEEENKKDEEKKDDKKDEEKKDEDKKEDDKKEDDKKEEDKKDEEKKEDDKKDEEKKEEDDKKE